MSRVRALEPKMKSRSEGAAWGEDGASHGRRSSDLFVCLALVVTAIFAVLVLPQGSWVRFALTLPMLFFVPGYLVLQAAVATCRRQPAERARQALLSIGISPGIVGILALATALVPGGFQSGIIIGVVTVTCVLLAVGALYRRHGAPHMQPAPHATANPSPDDADQML